MIIELHLLQSFPVSNLNRDDINQPKSATFGGYTRGRISSQCLKRSARLLFRDYGLAADQTGVRTKRLLTQVVDVLVDAGRDAGEATGVVQAALHSLGFGVDDTTHLTQYLLYVGRSTIDLLADYSQSHWDDLAAVTAARGSARATKVKPDKATLAEAKRILDASRAADVALFGRMIADNKDFNVTAASQVAHALSTHAVTNEFDFYTAVDDLRPDSESGADMLGTIDFNAACYYRYTNVDLTQLATNLDGDIELVARTARAWLHAFINAVPSGKQNAMAARTMPETLLGVVREHGAWNLANAFLNPITPGEDVMAASTNALINHFDRLCDFYGHDGIRTATAANLNNNLPAMEHVTATRNVTTFVDHLLAATAA
ncbi:type I-E CRISPR-associated protein Cas7/Cse4/CasC [Kutzneria sp. NPDC052558]|uniref:type I-E CRISPR-associated protein Cas7/Cse4/CasC n=1 Tax=Kutzneria sp. NPDC052558 TaxID=3364121 RepID=UPI0037CA71AD